MPQMRAQLQCGDQRPGGIKGYPLDRLYEEVAFIAYYFHWTHHEVMNLDHLERRKWCQEISRINKKLSHDEKSPPLLGS